MHSELTVDSSKALFMLMLRIQVLAGRLATHGMCAALGSDPAMCVQPADVSAVFYVNLHRRLLQLQWRPQFG